MLGHGRGGWSWMFLIALQMDARQLETRLIEEAKHQWPQKCTNVAPDSRGQCRGPNWIYVCINDLADSPHLRTLLRISAPLPPRAISQPLRLKNRR